MRTSSSSSPLYVLTHLRMFDVLMHTHPECVRPMSLYTYTWVSNWSGPLFSNKCVWLVTYKCAFLGPMGCIAGPIASHWYYMALPLTRRPSCALVRFGSAVCKLVLRCRALVCFIPLGTICWCGDMRLPGLTHTILAAQCVFSCLCVAVFVSCSYA